ncbi:sensor histidine kinase [Carboxylicivirga linearis]|uniref:Sensor histidine kinase n=1 Tax=Carboxylicivirga linearis TaxID=1628157 RepID=A0ABS5JS02_9BACT|nr:ATP-binding protein [Carboxylicivirga linearis]MBS2097620.1 hypothetical protein [Carboxylicivirga linearis]
MLIALVSSIFVQLIAALIAIRIAITTDKNYSWYLISFAFILMVLGRIVAVFATTFDDYFRLDTFNAFLTLLTSITFLFSLKGIRDLLNAQRKLETTKKVFNHKMLKAMINTEEQTKNKFAMELHDGLGPLLSIAQMTLSTIKSPRPENNDKLNHSKKLIEESIQTLKEVSNGLSPRVLIDFGIEKALKTFCYKLPTEETPHIQIHYGLKQRRYSFELEITMYRIICEVINNACKHAKANQVIINLVQKDDTVTIRCLDNGIGVDNDAMTKINGNGFINLQSRMEFLNGKGSIKTLEGRGTYVAVSFNTLNNESQN